MLRSKLLYTIEGKSIFGINRLFCPECAVIVEGGNACLDRDKIRSTLFANARYKIENRLLSAVVIP